jgi:uncharacterized protein YbcI
MSSPAPPGSGPDRSPAQQISQRVVALLQEYTGRGPQRARTTIDRLLVSVVLEDTLTKGERSLVDAGHGEHVLATRRAYQEAMREDAILAVEQILGCRVAAMLSANHIDPDLAVESFVLHPEGDG